jgi:hypothetical protein
MPAPMSWRKRFRRTQKEAGEQCSRQPLFIVALLAIQHSQAQSRAATITTTGKLTSLRATYMDFNRQRHSLGLRFQPRFSENPFFEHPQHEQEAEWADSVRLVLRDEPEED